MVAGSNEYSEVDYLNLSISFSKYQQHAFLNCFSTIPFGDYYEK